MVCVSNKMITMILLLSFLQITLAAPSQMPPFQGIMKQQMFQPSQETPLLQQLQRIHEQMALQGEMQIQQGSMQQQVPLLQPLQGTVMQQRLALQEQMFALQQFQALQRISLSPPFTSMNTPPILVLFPNNQPDMQPTDYNTNIMKYQKPEEMEDDSEIINAEPTEELNLKKKPMRAVLLIPNTRGLIGDFISGISFLPLEINVPDTISWLYNGIAGIIAGIGQSQTYKLQVPSSKTQNENSDNMKLIWNIMKKNQRMPLVVIPL